MHSTFITKNTNRLSFVKTKQPKHIDRRVLYVKASNNNNDIKHDELLLKTIEIRKELRKSIEDAKNICALIGNTIDCIVAWDAVSDISTGYYATKEKEQGYVKDPLAEFCDENPDDEQCKEYDV
jgi:hypothetical protein